VHGDDYPILSFALCVPAALRAPVNSTWPSVDAGLAVAPTAFITGWVLKLRREPELARDRARMAALAVAVLLRLQLAANYWALLYLVWVIPLVGLSVLADPIPAAQPTRRRFRRPVRSSPR
jgi:hypothetical protein